MNSFQLNKLLGAVLGTFLGVLAVHLAAGAIYAPSTPAKPGFVIAVKQTPSNRPAAAPNPQPEESIAQLLASASVDRGKADIKVCGTCHDFEKGGPNKIGPNLWGVVDRPRASEPGYDYSSAMKAKGGKWTFDELDEFLTHPQGYIPGTKMTFTGFSRGAQRADVIAYLRTVSDNPVPLPPAATAQQNGQVANQGGGAPTQQPQQQQSQTSAAPAGSQAAPQGQPSVAQTSGEVGKPPQQPSKGTARKADRQRD